MDTVPYIYHFDDLQNSVHNMTLLRQAYQRDGVVAIRGLLETSLLHRLDIASARHVQEEWDQQQQVIHKSNTAGRDDRGPRRKTRQGTQFFLNRNHLALTDPPFPLYSLSSTSTNSNNNSCSAADMVNEMQQQQSTISSSSTSSTAAAGDDNESNEMTMTMNPFLQTHHSVNNANQNKDDDHNNQNDNGNNNNNNNLRVMRDIFLAKDDDPYICGWHVDDFGFWPVTATSSPPGINAWIALDDYDINNVDGGGLALAIGSDIASWRHEAHFMTGASTTAPIDDYTSAKD
jgi:hypothetical protein